MPRTRKSQSLPPSPFEDASSQDRLDSSERLDVAIILWRGAPHVAVILGDEATRADIERVAERAVTLRERLVAERGPNPAERRQLLFLRLDAGHKNGVSYQKLALEVNTAVEALLRTMVLGDKLTADLKKFYQYEVLPDESSNGHGYYEPMYVRLWSLLDNFLPTDEDIGPILDLAIGRLEQGQSAFEFDPKFYPVSREMMREALRTWRDKQALLTERFGSVEEDVELSNGDECEGIDLSE